jgi:hypothetical protein
VPPFLSREWLDDLVWRAASVESVGFSPDVALSVGVDVPDAPGGPCRFVLSVAHGRMDFSAASDALTEVDLWITTDAETASALADGRITAQEALGAGTLTLRGRTAGIAALRKLLDQTTPDLRTVADPGAA